MESFRAFRIHEEAGAISARIDTIGLDDLSAGEVVVRIAYSDINYKDALAATGAGKILRTYPLVGGIDAAGTVVESSSDDFAVGDDVVITGCGLSETVDGGYAEYGRYSAASVVSLPAGLDARSAMALGTAGFTAALAVHRMEQNGQLPDAGPVLVNGATGGVGSVAIDMLAGRGYEVTALTSKSGAEDYLRGLGAASVLTMDEVDLGKRPLERAIWAGAIDNLGGEVLTWLTRTTGYYGNIASIGLAASHKLNTTVMPFILRGVSLLGINSVETPRAQRLDVWHRMAGDLKPRHLDKIVTREVTLDELPDAFGGYIEGKVKGRTLVRL
jgi:NADPH2:quinone reductase